MNEQRIALICDSGANTPKEIQQASDIRIVPLRINYADGSTYDSDQLSESQLVASFAREIPTTSLPSPEAILQTFKRAQADGYTSALVVTIASALSATNQTMRMVADQLQNFAVRIVDSKNIGPGAGMIASQAARLLSEGLSLTEAADTLEALVEKTHIYFTMKTLSYLRKGGRISEAVYRVGSVLNIKPVMTCSSDGSYAIAKKARGWDKSLDAVVDLAVAAAGAYDGIRACIGCSDACLPYAQQLEDALRSRVHNVVEVIHMGISPELLIHTGPDLAGIVVQQA